MTAAGRVLLIGIAVSLAVHGASYAVSFQKTISIPMLGASAAYTVDPEIAEASADQGIVTVLGRSPGRTHLIVITSEGVQTLEIVVPMPPPLYPRGWVAPRLEGISTEGGYYETRYSSLPQQLTNVLDFSRQGPDMTTHFNIATTDFFPSPNNPYDSYSVSRFAVTSLSYAIQTQDRSVTLVDKLVDESPLTVSGAIVRGLHWQEGDWFFNGGYTSPAAFAGVFLPIRPEGVFGTGYRSKLSKHSRLVPSFYYLTMPSATHTGNPGAIFSLQYIYEPTDKLRFSAEVGQSRGLGASSTLAYRRRGETLRARFRYTPESFAALSISNFRGLYSDLSWTRQWSNKFSSDFNFTGDRFNLVSFKESTVNGGLQVRYQVLRNWTFFGGATYSFFRMEMVGQVPLEGTYFPEGVGFNSHHFGATFQHQWSRFTEQNSGGHQYLASIRTGFGPLTFNAYAEHETQAPTVGFLLSQVNGLAQVLNQYGIVANTPQQIVAFLNQNAALINLQYLSNVSVNLTPVREQVSGSVAWLGRGYAPQIDYEFLYNNDQMVAGSTQVTINRLTFSQRLGRSNDLSLTIAEYRVKATGQPAAVNPLVAVSLTHHFTTTPGFLVFEHHGTIRGRAFEDQDGQGKYDSSLPGVADVEVILDGRRRTVTASDGSYVFSGVPQGKHEIQAVLHGHALYYFTTPEQMSVEQDSEVNLGLARTQASLAGEVRDTMLRGVPGIVVVIFGGGRRLTTVSGGDGTFLIPRLPEGGYSVFIDSDALPAGYVIDESETVRISASPGTAAKAALHVRALRSVSGRVVLYDRAAGRYVGLAGVTVVIAALSRRTVSGADGGFLFRELPSGSFTVSATYEGQTINRIVTMAPEPAQLTDVNLVMGQR